MERVLSKSGSGYHTLSISISKAISISILDRSP